MNSCTKIMLRAKKSRNANSYEINNEILWFLDENNY